MFRIRESGHGFSPEEATGAQSVWVDKATAIALPFLSPLLHLQALQLDPLQTRPSTSPSTPTSLKNPSKNRTLPRNHPSPTMLSTISTLTAAAALATLISNASAVPSASSTQIFLVKRSAIPTPSKTIPQSKHGRLVKRMVEPMAGEAGPFTGGEQSMVSPPPPLPKQSPSHAHSSDQSLFQAGAPKEHHGLGKIFHKRHHKEHHRKHHRKHRERHGGPGQKKHWWSLKRSHTGEEDAAAAVGVASSFAGDMGSAVGMMGAGAGPPM